VVKEQNIYRWAANLIGDLCEVRLDSPSALRVANEAAAATLPPEALQR
jgi:hypothetical protein